jgi:menaquinone-dependent protoporphyrinogen oxidase
MKALVTYATMTGSTAEVAEIIGKTIREKGYQVDVTKAGDVKTLEGYDFIIAGTGIRAGKTFKPFDMFIQKHGEYMKQKPNALFVVCLTMKEDTCQNRDSVIKYIDKQMSVNPLDVGTFAGVMDFKKIGFLLAAIIKKIDKSGNPEGNFIDENKIKSWTNSLLEKIKQ